MNMRNIVVFGAVLVVALIVGLTARKIGAAPITVLEARQTTLQNPLAAGSAGGNGEVQDVVLRMEGWRYVTDPATLRAGVPVRLRVDLSTVTGCMRDIVLPAWNVRKYVSQGDNMIGFTPTEAGQFPISCSMGMGRGLIVVAEHDGMVPEPSAAQQARLTAPDIGGRCGAPGGGCGCGGG